MDDRPWFVQRARFSERVAPEDLAVFMRTCPERVYRKGDIVFRQGDPATELHVIARGQIKLVTPTVTGHERILAVCGADDLIGEAFLREAHRYRADAVALTDVVTCPMDRDQFLEMARSAPSFALAFSEILATHLLHCREQLGSAYDPIPIRVAKVLFHQARSFGRPGLDGWVELETALRHEEIASIASATRVSVSMALSDLRRRGLVEGTRGRYRLHLASLTDFIEGIGPGWGREGGR